MKLFNQNQPSPREYIFFLSFLLLNDRFLSRGQVSFPGGKSDEKDKDVVETALR